ncbi:MAG TPA: phage head-tail connector protein [Stellaceae bacterium]|nr:phage head-tail connector protein [Stellaceae bacterium]
MTYGDLTTLADVKAWLQTGQSAFPPTDDALLTRLITAASQYIQTWLNRPIALCDYIEVRDGTGGQRLQFACFPVSAVLSLTIDGLAIPPAPEPSPSTGLTAGYVFSPTQLAVHGYYFTRRAQNVVVTYMAGYPITPPEIAQACIELVALRYRERTRIGEVSRAVGGGETVTYSQKDMSAPIATLLQQYRAVSPIVGYSVMKAPTSTDPAILTAAL